jgi:hypothetical protein
LPPFSGTAAATCSRWFFARGFFYPEDGGDTILRNVGSIDHIYTAAHPRRRHSSFSQAFKKLGLTAKVPMQTNETTR